MRSVIASLSATTAPAPYLTSLEAARLIHAAQPISIVSDQQEPLFHSTGLGGWLSLGSNVEVTPDDSGRVPQKGQLIALNPERTVIEVTSSQGTKARVHFPRLGFAVTVAKKAKASL